MRSHWNKTSAQLKFIERIWRELSAEHLAIQEETLIVLVTKLQSATKKIDGLIKPGIKNDQNKQAAVKRWKYVFVKPYLDDTIKALRKWQAIYDPSWWLILRIADPFVDTALKQRLPSDSEHDEGTAVLQTARRLRRAIIGDYSKGEHIFLPSSGLDSTKVTSISRSSAEYFHRKDRNGASKHLVVDTVTCLAGSSTEILKRDVKSLVRRLQQVDPAAFGLLKCRGVVYLDNSFKIVFETPSQGPPRTLRSCLEAQTSHTLTARVEVACKLAKAVAHIHTLDFVHKSICPENLIGFEADKSQLGAFYLVGFEQVRSADGATYRHGDSDWEKNLYRHPSRQGLLPMQKYSMQHDVYSLGVCLLEIGLWETFVLYDQRGRVKAPNAALLGLSLEKVAARKPSEIKNLLVELAIHKLPLVVGEIYAEVVVNCLTCLDSDNVDFADSDEFENQNGVAVGVRYLQKACLSLSRDGKDPANQCSGPDEIG